MKRHFGSDSTPVSITRAALLCFLFSFHARAAVLTVSPGSVSSQYEGRVALTVTGVSPGQSVLIEKFADFNANGAIDPGDLLIQSFRLTDGIALSFAGVRNANMPGDEDGAANGQILATSDFRIQEVDRAVGRYLYRASPAASGFVPATAGFAVGQASFVQKVSGRVMSGSSGIGHAFVALLSLGADHKLVAAASSDANGGFSINADAGVYLLAAFKRGFVFDFGKAPMVAVQPGSGAVQNVNLDPAGTRQIAGRVRDASSGEGIAGAEIFFESGTGLVTLTFSDSNGDFAAPVSSETDEWALSVSDSVTMLGYLEHSGRRVETTGGNISGLNLDLTPITALIHGRFLDDQNRPIGGVMIRANQGEFAGNGVTDEAGNYWIGVTAGEWQVRPVQEADVALGMISATVRLALRSGEAKRADLTGRRITAHLRGQVLDELGVPLANIGFGASDWLGYDSFADADERGQFELGLFAGTWHLQLETQEAGDRGLIGPDLTIDLKDGTVLAGISYRVRRTTASVRGLLLDNAGQSLTGIAIYGRAVLAGQTYRVHALTDERGAFRIGVFDGQWEFGVDCSALSARGLACLPEQPVTVLGGDRVIGFMARPAGGARVSLDRPEILYDGRVRFWLRNLAPGRTYAIETSDDLTIWTTRSTVMPSSADLEFIDDSTPGRARRFYRVRTW